MTESITGVQDQPRNATVEMFAGFWANPDASVIPGALAEDVVGHFPGEPRPVRGPAAYTAWVARVLELLPDLRLEVAEHAANGEFTFIRWIARARGANGTFEFSGMDRIRVRDGLVKENIVVFDTALFEKLVGAKLAGPRDR
jgi:hypothetical protein